MKELIIIPSEFQKEIDAFKESNTGIEDVEYKVDFDKMSLDSINDLTECLKDLNELLEYVIDYGEKNVRNLQNMKSAFLQMDMNLGNMTVGEYIKDKITGDKQ